MTKKFTGKYEHLVFVSQDNLEKFEEMYQKVTTKKSVIYNYLNKENILKKAEEYEPTKLKSDETNLVSVARLVEQKAIDRLLKVHKKLLENGLKHRVYIIGEGPLKETLENQIKEKQVGDTFYLLGKKENPYPYIKRADYFCLLSYFEGYGMVIEEAKILNKFIVLTNTAAREAVKNYENKTIVENSEEAIYEGLKELLQTKNKRENRNIISYDNQEMIQEVENLLEPKKEVR